MFLAIHPRSVILSASRSRPVRLPEWLDQLRAWRAHSQGWYAETPRHRVIAHGPLGRRERHPAAANAESLRDRFAALTVVSREFEDSNGKPIQIVQRVYDSSATSGIPLSDHPGHEKIAFLPVANRREDIELTQAERYGKLFVVCRAADCIDPARIIFDALTEVSNADIAIAPEFVVNETQAGQLMRRLTTAHCELSRLIIAGSGASVALDENRPWNEARALNSFGGELWRQRKLWPASILSARAVQFNLSDPKDAMIQEDTAAGDEIVVVDADTLGRGVILICQDLENTPVASEVIRQYQPDWVFAPILDAGIQIGRWAHQSVFSMSRFARTRFLVSCNNALIDPAQASVSYCGLAVGPRDEIPAGFDHDAGRLYAAVQVQSASPGYAVVRWRSGSVEWKQSTFS